MEDLGAFVRSELGMQNLADAASSCVLCNQQSTSTRPAKSGRCEIKMLHCLHSVCGGCLEEYLQKGKEVLCPICDARTVERNYHRYLCNFAEHQGIDYQTMQQHRRIECEECVDNADAVYYCEQCVRSLCEDCSEHHKRSKATTMHSLITLHEQQESKMHRAALCMVHSNPHEFFCKDCSMMCCRECILADHENHNYQLPSAGLVESEREVVSHQITELRGLARQLQDKHQLLTQLMKEIDAGLEKSKAGVEQMEDEVKRAIQERREAIVEEIDSFSVWHRLAFEKKRSMLTSTMVSAWSIMDFVNKVLARGTDIEVLFLRSSINLMEDFCNLNVVADLGDCCASVAFQHVGGGGGGVPDAMDAIRGMGTASLPSPLVSAELSHSFRGMPAVLPQAASSGSLAAAGSPRGEMMPLKVVTRGRCGSLSVAKDAPAGGPLACQPSPRRCGHYGPAPIRNTQPRMQADVQPAPAAEALLVGGAAGATAGAAAAAGHHGRPGPAGGRAGREEPEVAPEPSGAAAVAMAEAGRRRLSSDDVRAVNRSRAHSEAQPGQSADDAEPAPTAARERTARRRRGGRRSANKHSKPAAPCTAVPLTPGIVIREPPDEAPRTISLLEAGFSEARQAPPSGGARAASAAAASTAVGLRGVPTPISLQAAIAEEERPAEPTQAMSESPRRARSRRGAPPPPPPEVQQAAAHPASSSGRLPSPPPQLPAPMSRSMSSGGVHARTDEELTVYGLGPRRALLGSEGTGLGMFRSPCGMCMDTDHIYIADTLNHRIQVFDRQTHEPLGLVSLPHGSGVSALQDPSGLCCMGDRQLTVVEYGLDRLLSVELSEDSLEVKRAFVLADTQLYGPFGVGVSQGRIIVCDSCNHRCLVLSSSGKILGEIGTRGVGPGQFEYPDCVATFSDGHIAISDKDNHRVQVFDADGNFSQFIPSHWAPRASGSKVAPPGQFRGPMGMCTDARDRLYVCDCGSNRVQIFTRQGRWLWSSDGSSALCYFRSPTAIQIDKGGTVYIASDHCVQIF